MQFTHVTNADFIIIIKFTHVTNYTPNHHVNLSSFARKMPSSAILHAAFFAAGAVIGGGMISVVSSKQRQTSSPVPTVNTGKSILPVVNIGANGDARITNSAAAVAVSLPVLKYGNPGS